MNIDVFLKRNEEKKEVYVKLIDMVNRVERTWQEEFTDFLTPDEQYFLNLLSNRRDIYIKYFGGKGNYERAVALISRVDVDTDFPVDIIKVNGNFKFEKLTHRDYLGTLLSLGIKREKIGDINVFDDGAEIYVARELSDYIIFNLNKIKHTGVKLERISYEKAREKTQSLKEIFINVASLRMDAVISEVYNLSRSEASSLIKQGNVKVNYISNDEQSYKLDSGDIVSVKGFGRFVFNSVVRNTKSQRLVVSIKKYV